MAVGWLIAAPADFAVAREIGAGFDLAVIDPAEFADPDALCERVADADNVGVLLSNAAAFYEPFVATLFAMSRRVGRVQLILVDPGAREKLDFIPAGWPAMSLGDALHRARIASERRGDATPPPTEEPEAPPSVEEPPAPPPAPVEEPPAPPPPENASPETMDEPQDGFADEPADETIAPEETPADFGDAPEQVEAERKRAAEPEQEVEASPEPEAPETQPEAEEQAAPQSGGGFFGTTRSAPAAPPPMPSTDYEAPPPFQAAPTPAPMRRTEDVVGSLGGATRTEAPADATAFAPKKLRRGTPELVRVVIHQPQDLKAVIKAAKKIDPRAEPTPQSMGIGDVAIGASIGVALEVRGALCNETDVTRHTWSGDPLDFAFVVEAEDDVKQAVIIARVFIDDAQIGMIAFTRAISGPKKKPADVGDGARMKRFKRVFLSYSSEDRETVSTIATAYEMAGVEHFWDRTSLKSGEEWSPRLKREIDRADLFHLCWSKAASTSQWVEKEAEHALTRRKRTSGKTPAITVQMLDGPPWAAHPAALDSINFDDFVRAAIVGYARGES